MGKPPSLHGESVFRRATMSTSIVGYRARPQSILSPKNDWAGCSLVRFLSESPPKVGE